MSRKKKPRTSGEMVLEMRGLEIARGRDGPLRGAPEPVVVVAVYAADAEPRMVGRALWRFPAPVARLPTSVPAVEPSRPVTHGYAMEKDALLLVLAVGLEEDSGADVRRVYGLLERAAHLQLWSLDAGGSHPAPGGIAQISPDLARPARVRVLVDDLDIGMVKKPGDDWVGACAVALPRARLFADHRLHLADDVGGNDWTALLKVRAG